jgi:hypothetical protein
MSDQHKTPEELEAEIALQREQLAGTVDELAAKLDVKSQAQRKVAALKDSATTDDGRPRKRGARRRRLARRDGRGAAPVATPRPPLIRH